VSVTGSFRQGQAFAFSAALVRSGAVCIDRADSPWSAFGCGAIPWLLMATMFIIYIAIRSDEP